MFKFAVVAALLIVAVSARPKPQEDEGPQILEMWNNSEGDKIDFGFEMSDGTKRIERGFVEGFGTPEAKTIITEGLFQYPLSDSRYFRSTYSTDPATGAVNQKPEFLDKL